MRDRSGACLIREGPRCQETVGPLHVGRNAPTEHEVRQERSGQSGCCGTVCPQYLRSNRPFSSKAVVLVHVMNRMSVVGRQTRPASVSRNFIIELHTTQSIIPRTTSSTFVPGPVLLASPPTWISKSVHLFVHPSTAGQTTSTNDSRRVPVIRHSISRDASWADSPNHAHVQAVSPHHSTPQSLGANVKWPVPRFGQLRAISSPNISRHSCPRFGHPQTQQRIPRVSPDDTLWPCAMR
jgi:hypothetical protein